MVNLRLLLRDIILHYRNIVLRLFLHRVKYEPSKVKIRNILAIRMDRIGDLVMTTPALKVLHEYFPHSKIHIMVKKPNGGLLKNLPFVSNIYECGGFSDCAKRLRNKKFDLAIDFLMDYPMKTTLLAYLSRAPLLAGFDIVGKKGLFDISVTVDPKKKQMSYHMLDLAKAIIMACLGKEVADLSAQPILAADNEHKKTMEVFFKKQEPSGRYFFIGIHPGGYYESQRWPINNFSRLADELKDRYKLKIVAIGIAEEIPLIDKMISAMKYKDVIKIIDFPLDKLIALISVMDVLVCNNSGPLHMAVALNTPTVSTMGPTDPHFWYPSGDKHIVIKKDLNCSPCNKSKCIRHDCMNLITVDEVLKAVQGLLNNLTES
ncbi:MAG: glycosyltransferase family 9 protein [Candidatus Omnitrophica bacterium]|nr:glycosyltransferase family 9 protein [Candidatus Omnitrophota bacterium]